MSYLILKFQPVATGLQAHAHSVAD